MALPAIGDGEQVGDGNTGETLNVGRSGQTVKVQPSSSGSLSFYGATATAQPASAAQAALTLVTGLSNGFGFTTTTAFSAFVAQVENIRASLVALGLLKGSA